MSNRISCIIIAAVIVIGSLIVICFPVRQYQDCFYCHVPVELRAEPTIQNHWHDADSIICDDCFRNGYR